MRMFALPQTLLAGTLLVSMHALPAQAVNLNHTWVASNGDNAANCDRLTPCATFAGAFGKTNAGGEITCVDSGNYSGLTIDKSITINCENAIGSNTSLGGNQPGTFVITTAATDIVTLRGLDIDGLGFNCTCGLINFFGAGVLHVDKVKISNLRPFAARGIEFSPSGAAKLFVSDSFITDNGSSGINAGINITP